MHESKFDEIHPQNTFESVSLCDIISSERHDVIIKVIYIACHSSRLVSLLPRSKFPARVIPLDVSDMRGGKLKETFWFNFTCYLNKDGCISIGLFVLTSIMLRIFRFEKSQMVNSGRHGFASQYRQDINYNFVTTEEDRKRLKCLSEGGWKKPRCSVEYWEEI